MTLAVEWIGREQSGFKETSCKAVQLLVRSDGGLDKEVAVEEVRKSTQKPYDLMMGCTSGTGDSRIKDNASVSSSDFDVGYSG